MIATYYTTPNVLTSEECDAIINHCSTRCKPSDIIDDNDSFYQDRSIRNTVNTFLSKEDYDVLPMINKVVNNVVKTSYEIFNFPIGMIEDIQYAEYSKGMYYDDHIDSGFTLDYDRDISASVILTPRDQYVGGNLGFRKRSGYLDVDEQQGTVVVFSSMLVHRVKEVEEGRRSSLSLWCRRNF
jgi:predicted 2-oxoglutarate/Fe(II)-dependent dioxygenase YbiX|tara:strand:+ start:55 stop:603 length:549 start_codon:yes stop_codon:yes gene_type:complete